MIVIQFLAMLTMLIDHIGLIWFPTESSWRIIGRLAFPFYAYALVLGFSRTRSIQRYLKRTAIIALLSQLPYQWAFQRLEVNTVGTLFMCLLLLHLLDKWKSRPVITFSLVAAFCIFLEWLPFSYGAYAVILVLIYRYAQLRLMALLHFVLNLADFLAKGAFLQGFSLIATLMLAYMPDFMRYADRIRIPRIVWRSFYPLHLALLAAAAFLMSPASMGDIMEFILVR